MGRLDEAAAHAELGLKGSPGMANSLLAQIALARDRPAEAEKAARAALASPGSRIAPLMTLAQVLQKQERLAEALSYADQAAAELARTGAAGQRYAGLHWVRGDLLGPARPRRRGGARVPPGDPRLPPRHPGLLEPRAALRFRGRAQEAVATLRRMVEGDGSPAAYAEAVKTLRILGDPQSAAALLRHALAVHPESKELRRAG